MTSIPPCGPRSRPTAPCDGEVSPASSGACSSLNLGFVAAFVGMDITPEQSLTRFPDISAARTVENSLNLVVLLLWVIHSLALYRTLRRTSPTPALFGTVLSILGPRRARGRGAPARRDRPALRPLPRSWSDAPQPGDPVAGVARHRGHVRRAALHRTRHPSAG